MQDLGQKASAKKIGCFITPRTIPLLFAYASGRRSLKMGAMFTGIVEETGRVEAITPGTKSIRLSLRAALAAQGARLGDSLAVNGCCLTMVGIKKRILEFDLLKETWERTSFKSLQVGSAVNLERSLAVGDRLHGHFVTGHIDAAGVVKKLERRGADWLLEVAAPAVVMRCLVFKGAIAVDGISLTVAEVLRGRFRVWIIPHTYEVTALRERSPGSPVNLEADILAKYTARLLGK